jgi:thiol-disulfide isomerase/thioredoxin
MRRLTAGLAPVLGVLLALTGCSAKDALEAPSADKIPVATAEMVAMKQKAGVAPCPAPETTHGGLPSHTLRCLGGGRDVDLSTLKGPLVLNFFASTCAPCRQEMPALERFYRDHGRQVPVLGVDYIDTYPGVALQKAVGRGVTYPLVADPLGDLQGTDLSVSKFPTFFFLSADGKVSTELGGKTSEAEIVAMVEKHLGLDL